MTDVKLTGLNLFPVKGLRGLPQETLDIEACGPAGDRRWLITDPDRRFITQREVAELACISAVPTDDGLSLQRDDATCAVPFPAEDAPVEAVGVWHHQILARRAEEGVNDWLSASLGRPSLLWYMHDTGARPMDPGTGPDGQTVSFADAYPLLAVNRASLDALNDAFEGEPVPMNRFRANLVIEGVPAWDENRWRAVRIGGVRFLAPNACARCVVITRDQETGAAPQPGEPLKTLGRLNTLPEGIAFGINLIPESSGRLSIGDPVVVEERLDP